MAGRFAIDVSRFINKTQSNIDVVIRKIVFDVFVRVVLKTPVDTGRLVGNWFPTIGTPSNMFNEGSTDPDKTAAQTRIRDITQGIKPGETIYLINNTPYANFIESGGSRIKAPQGMVNITLQEYRGIVERAASEVRR